MALKRLDLPDGQWADQRTVPTNAQFRAIQESDDWQSMGRQLTEAWYVRGDDGQPLPLGREPDGLGGHRFDDAGWGAADAGLILDICAGAAVLFNEWLTQRRPKVTTTTSSDDTSEAPKSP